MSFDSSTSPTVCICIPTYNAELTIKQTLESILQQTYRNIVVYVVDNCSTDKTKDLVLSFNDTRITLHKNDTNIGAEGNFNRCIDLACGDFTAIYHADDLYEPEIVQKQVEFFQNHSDVGLVLTMARLIDANSNPLSVCTVPKSVVTDSNIYDFNRLIKGVMQNGNFMFCPSAMVRTSIYKNEIKSWRGDLFGSSADLDLWLRIALAHKVAILPEPLLNYRISSSQFSALVRRSTERADFFKVMDFYLHNSYVQCLSPKDIMNYRTLEQRDQIMRALNLFLQSKNNEARTLTQQVYSLSFLKVATSSQRGAMIWLLGALLRALLVLNINAGGRKLLHGLMARYNK